MAEEREVRAMTRGVVAWGHARWPGCRAMLELRLGSRRIDVAFVLPADLVGVEIKSSGDRLDRLADQYEAYSRFVPEMWIAVAPRWREKIERAWRVHNKMVVDARGAVETIGEYRAKPGEPGRRPFRDELSIMRLIELLRYEEAERIAERTGVFPGARDSRVRTRVLRPMIARLLTGNEILREVCAELSGRRGAGEGSDPPVKIAPAQGRTPLATSRTKPVVLAPERPAGDG